MVKGGMINAKMRDEGGSARTLGAVKNVFPATTYDEMVDISEPFIPR